FDDVLGLGPDALVTRNTFFGTDRASGGAFELLTINLWAFGPDGRFARVEVFDADRDAGALARFDELPTASSAGFENAATRLGARVRDAWAARDLERVAALFPPG